MSTAPAASASGAGWRQNLGHALMATVLTAIVVTPIFGLHLERAGVRTHIVPRWDMVGWACLIVFVVQLLHPWIFGRATRRLPRLALPALSARQNTVLLTLVLLVAVTWPFFAGRNAVDIATLAMIYVMLGLGLNVVVGFAGLLDLGFVGFYAVGAYTYALLFHWAGWSFWEALPLAGAAAALFGFVLGFPVLRLRGDYLAIVTLGFGEIIRLILVNWTEFSGGPNGIGQIPRPTFFGLPFSPADDAPTFSNFFGLEYAPQHRVIFLYYLILMLALLTQWFISRLRRLPVGLAWEAVREDEVACRALGMNVTNIKLSAFAIGAMLGGFAGVFFAARQGFISPESFVFSESATILAIVVLGGMGSQLGVVIAAVVLVLLPELGRDFAEYRMLLFGAAMILIMVWRPGGLISRREPTVRLGPTEVGPGGGEPLGGQGGQGGLGGQKSKGGQRSKGGNPRSADAGTSS